MFTNEFGKEIYPKLKQGVTFSESGIWFTVGWERAMGQVLLIFSYDIELASFLRQELRTTRLIQITHWLEETKFPCGRTEF